MNSQQSWNQIFRHSFNENQNEFYSKLHKPDFFDVGIQFKQIEALKKQVFILKNTLQKEKYKKTIIQQEYESIITKLNSTINQGILQKQKNILIINQLKQSNKEKDISLQKTKKQIENKNQTIEKLTNLLISSLNKQNEAQQKKQKQFSFEKAYEIRLQPLNIKQSNIQNIICEVKNQQESRQKQINKIIDQLQKDELNVNIQKKTKKEILCQCSNMQLIQIKTELIKIQKQIQKILSKSTFQLDYKKQYSKIELDNKQININSDLQKIQKKLSSSQLKSKFHYINTLNDQIQFHKKFYKKIEDGYNLIIKNRQYNRYHKSFHKSQQNIDK